MMLNVLFLRRILTTTWLLPYLVPPYLTSPKYDMDFCHFTLASTNSHDDFPREHPSQSFSRLTTTQENNLRQLPTNMTGTSRNDRRNIIRSARMDYYTTKRTQAVVILLCLKWLHNKSERCSSHNQHSASKMSCNFVT